MIDCANMVGVTTADPTEYEQMFNGKIGIQPASSTYAKYDFLDSLMKQGKDIIDNKIISFYLDTNNVYNGVVEVGKWDYNGIHGNRNCASDPATCVHPMVHKTLSGTSWDMYLSDITIEGSPVNVDHKYVIIDPSERLIKMNEGDLDLFNAKLIATYPNLGLDCTSSTSCVVKNVCA